MESRPFYAPEPSRVAEPPPPAVSTMSEADKSSRLERNRCKARRTGARTRPITKIRQVMYTDPLVLPHQDLKGLHVQPAP